MERSSTLTAQFLFGPITKWDNIVLQWLHSHTTPFGIHMMVTFTMLGTEGFIAIPGIGIGALLAHKRKWMMLKGWIAALVGGPIIENILKWTIRRPRPEFAAPFLHGFSYSFPSGHAMNSTIAFGMLAYILITFCTRRRAAKIGIVIFTVLFVLAIGFSRLYLGVHYLSDVLGGFASGIVWLAACIVFTETSQRRQEIERHKLQPNDNK
jgi:undecaprenyl-diphosphatase